MDIADIFAGMLDRMELAILWTLGVSAAFVVLNVVRAGWRDRGRFY